MLADFYEDSTYDFDITITIDGNSPNITSDTVTLYLRRRGTNIRYSFSADVSGGTSGTAAFRLSPQDTNILAGDYQYQIVWFRSDGNVYVIAAGNVVVKERIPE